MPNEVLSLWPKDGKVLGKLTHEAFCHVHLLCSRRNSLAHEVRIGVFEALEWDYKIPYYGRAQMNGLETWIPHYPVGFLSALARTCLEKMGEWLEANDLNPYDHYKTRDFMLEELA
jgi:hypothetical protein